MCLANGFNNKLISCDKMSCYFIIFYSLIIIGEKGDAFPVDLEQFRGIPGDKGRKGGPGTQGQGGPPGPSGRL